MSRKFKYISESDRNAIRSARNALKRLKKKFVKMDKKSEEAFSNSDWWAYGPAVWRMLDELEWIGVQVDNDTDNLSITV